MSGASRPATWDVLARRAASSIASLVSAARSIPTPVLRGTRRCGGALIALGIALEASADPPRALPDLLPPGIRPAAERSRVETRPSPYGERLVERLGDAAPTAGEAAPEVEYTVDPALEAEVRAVLAEGRVALGHVIVMDPRDGEIFAYVSTDPERFPATRTYPTASLMKIVTAAGVLQRAPAAATRTCRSVGSPYLLEEAHLSGDDAASAALASASGSRGPATAGAGGGGHADALDPTDGPDVWTGSFTRALAISHNQCFARHAVHDLGERALLEEMRRVGFLEPPAASHPPGSVDPVETRLDLGNLGSGLAGSAITPLGAARLGGLLATGRLPTPRWIAALRDPGVESIMAFGPSESRPVWEPEVAGALRGHLQAVTETGTARRAFRNPDGTPRLGPVATAGKTGTLRGPDPEGLYQWFVGVAPADAPTLAVAAVVVHADGAPRGASASEVAASTLERVFCEEGAGCAAERAEALLARADRRAEAIERERAVALAAALAEAERNATLDEPPRPLDVARVELPRRLRRRAWQGEVVLRIDVGPGGEVVGAAVDSSDLPSAFGEFLVEEVRDWRFTPPSRGGRPSSATVRLPFPIRVE